MKIILVPPIQYLPREYLEKWIRACVKQRDETNPTGSRCRCTKIETEAGFRIVVVVADSEAVTIGFHNSFDFTKPEIHISSFIRLQGQTI